MSDIGDRIIAADCAKPRTALEMAEQSRQRFIQQQREEQTRFATGAVRSADRAGQRYDLISPVGMRRLAETCHEGAIKYSDHNWEKGMPVHDILNHAISHIYAYLSGDRTEDHLAHGCWNLMAAMHSEELWPKLNAGHLRGPGCTAPSTADEPDEDEDEEDAPGPDA